MIRRVEFAAGRTTLLVDRLPQLPPTEEASPTLAQNPPRLTLRWPDAPALGLPAPPWWLPADHHGRTVPLRWAAADGAVLREEQVRLEVLGSARPAYPIDLEVETLEVELGALVEVMVWESHRRGRNWAATISPDPRAPGGLARDFWPKARGRYYYLVPENLQPPTPIEFGADYYSSRGNPHRCRWYGVVLAVLPDRLYLEPAASALKAIRRAEELKARPAPDEAAGTRLPQTRAGQVIL